MESLAENNQHQDDRHTQARKFWKIWKDLQLGRHPEDWTDETVEEAKAATLDICSTCSWKFLMSLREDMNNSWRLHPLNFGEFEAIERSLFVYHTGFGEKIKAPCVAWLLDNGQERILVDTGPWDPENAKKYHGYGMINSGPAAIEEALAEYDLALNDVNHVLLTHLHWDHTSNVEAFSNATFYVQRKELFYAVDPLPVHRLTYELGLDIQPP